MSALQALELLHMSYAGRSESRGVHLAAINHLYGIAIHELSKELLVALTPSISTFMSTTLLLVIELLHRRRQNGLKHTIGAVSLLTSGEKNHEVHSVDHLCRIYDLQCLIFSEGARMPTNERAVDFFDNPTSNLLDIERWCVNSLHSAHISIAQVSHDAVFDCTASHERDILGHVEQLRIAETTLRVCLNLSGTLPARAVLLILLNLVLMTILQLQQLYATHECSWDAYFKYFDMILQNVEEIDISAARYFEQRHFSLHLGIIPPLQMVAFKCRHLSLRRRAIARLQLAGCEGPFVGPQIAAMAARCLEIEGQAATPSSCAFGIPVNQSMTADIHDSSDLPKEELRVSTCALLESQGQEVRLFDPYNGRTSVRMLRRREPGLSIKAHFVTSTSFRSMVSAQFLETHKLDSTMWEHWTEEIQFGDRSGQDTSVTI